MPLLPREKECIFLAVTRCGDRYAGPISANFVSAITSFADMGHHMSSHTCQILMRGGGSCKFSDIVFAISLDFGDFDDTFPFSFLHGAVSVTHFSKVQRIVWRHSFVHSNLRLKFHLFYEESPPLCSTSEVAEGASSQLLASRGSLCDVVRCRL